MNSTLGSVVPLAMFSNQLASSNFFSLSDSPFKFLSTIERYHFPGAHQLVLIKYFFQSIYSQLFFTAFKSISPKCFKVFLQADNRALLFPRCREGGGIKWIRSLPSTPGTCGDPWRPAETWKPCSQPPNLQFSNASEGCTYILHHSILCFNVNVHSALGTKIVNLFIDIEEWGYHISILNKFRFSFFSDSCFSVFCVSVSAHSILCVVVL